MTWERGPGETAAAICRRMYDELLSTSYPNWLPSLPSDTASFLMARENLPKEEKVKAECNKLLHALELLSTCCFYPLGELLRMLPEEMTKEDAERVVGYVVSPIREVSERIVNGWLVRRIRDVGSVSERILDNYNEFRDKWNDIIGQMEREASNYGLKVRVPERAKELGVKLERKR